MTTPGQARARIRSFFTTPVRDFLGALDRVIPEPPHAALAVVFVGFAVAWWIYVPAHELLHALGCVATGGSVHRLEIDRWYGAALLQRIFPFVAVGSDYAGQLTGFETGGNDGIYLATVFAPFLLTVFVGVPLLRRPAQRGIVSSFLFGASVPVAFAPFTNLIGDYYEMGSILVSRSARLLGFEVSLERWRSDDLIKTVSGLISEGSMSLADATGILLGALVGVLLAFATYALGVAVSIQLESLVARRRNAPR